MLSVLVCVCAMMSLVFVASFFPRRGNRRRGYIETLGPEDKLRYASKALAAGIPLRTVRRAVGLEY